MANLRSARKVVKRHLSQILHSFGRIEVAPNCSLTPIPSRLENFFDCLFESLSDLQRQGQTRIVTTILNRIYGLA